MKNYYLLLAVIFISIISNDTFAQCAAGKNQFTLDWDQHEFARRPFSGVTTDQRYQFGGNNNTLTIAYSGVTTQLDNPYHTVATGSFGSDGDDVQFTGNGTITLTFTTEVDNLKFSLFDVDGSEAVNFSAVDALANPQIITLSTVGATNLTLNNNPGSIASANAGAATVSPTNPANAPKNTLNVNIPGPVKTVVITLSNAASEEIWLSDISACTPDYNFPADYLSITRPNTGAPQYFLAIDLNKVNLINLATGNSTLLFQDAAFTGLNALAVDPYKAKVYYTGNDVIGSNLQIKRYDIRTGTISTFVADVNTIGIPTNTEGVGSGGGSFYNGSLYFSSDPETNNTDSLDDVIWRIDIDPLGNALPAIEVKSFNNGINPDIHNWGDMGLINGKLFDFNVDNGSDFTSQRFNMRTGQNDLFHFGSNCPRQMAVGWDNKIYSISSEIRQFDTLSGFLPAAGTGLALNGNWPGGNIAYDASEMFKLLADYGSMDPLRFEDPASVIQGNHAIYPDIYLGDVGPDEESCNPGVWDGPEDDGIDPLAVLLYSTSTSYTVPVKAFNNTGAVATMCGFIDFNDDGDFTDAGEKICVTVPSSPTVQTIDLPFTGYAAPASGSTVNFRIRISTDASKIQTIFDGAPDGEVEDYLLPVINVLKVQTTNFSVVKIENSKAKIDWQIADETNKKKYVLERSSDGIHFYEVYSLQLPINSQDKNKRYSYTDNTPQAGHNYYRLKMIENDNAVSFSNILLLNFMANQSISFFPNPVKRGQYLTINYAGDKIIKTVNLINELGQKVTHNINNDRRFFTGNMAPGVYQVIVNFNDGTNEKARLLITNN